MYGRGKQGTVGAPQQAIEQKNVVRICRLSFGSCFSGGQDLGQRKVAEGVETLANRLSALGALIFLVALENILWFCRLARAVEVGMGKTG